MSELNKIPNRSRWPHRWAVLLCALTFPLICVGGLITTTDAGMAVPDWPGTYGFNMFAYPWQTWFFGPWDLFVEHGHRLLGSLVGLVSIGFLVAVWWTDDREWMGWLAKAALALVIWQGMLGGMRVLANERLVAMAHGVTGPVFFAFTCVLWVVTSRAWDNVSVAGRYGSNVAGHSSLTVAGHSEPDSVSDLTAAAICRSPARLAMITAILIFCQLMLGAGLRHLPETGSPWIFANLVKLHLILAAIVAGHVLWLAVRAAGGKRWPRSVRWLCLMAGGILLLQVTAGLATWWLKYGLPGWAVGLLPDNMEATTAIGWVQTTVVTSHQAGGSLLLALTTAAAVLAFRLMPAVRKTVNKSSTTNAVRSADPTLGTTG